MSTPNLLDAVPRIFPAAGKMRSPRRGVIQMSQFQRSEHWILREPPRRQRPTSGRSIKSRDETEARGIPNKAMKLTKLSVASGRLSIDAVAGDAAGICLSPVLGFKE
jgi:hypothetical protein